jgi:DNA helicase II / ATP-dependent DNA helicase PcrA
MNQSSHHNQLFNEAFMRLNAEQKQAVTTIDGPVMVVAGPGTGKTQILTLRIAHILQVTDTAPEQILALTFTDSGARAMRERLANFVGSVAYRVPIHTFHSFASNLIANYPDSYPKIVGGRPATPVEKVEIIETVLNQGSEFKVLRPQSDPNYHINTILSAIADLKKEYCSPDRFAVLLDKQVKDLVALPRIHEKGAYKGKVRSDYLKAEKSLHRNQELLSLYRYYEASLQANRWFDFEDMIIDTVDALKANESMLRDVQERYLYCLADEHQDVNQSQNELLEVITSYHNHPNLFVVGDEKQAIYRFQGASLDNFLFFTNKHAEAKVISLTENYRSGQKILDLAQALMETEDPVLKTLRVPLNSHLDDPGALYLRHFNHEHIENDWIAEKIISLHESGVGYRGIAVIVRTNREVSILTDLFKSKNLPVHASSEKNLLDHPVLLSVIDLVQVASDPQNEAALASVLHLPYVGLERSDVGIVLLARGKRGTLWRICTDREMLEEIGVKNIDELLNFTSLIKAISDSSLTMNPVEQLALLLNQSGFADMIMRQDPIYGASLVRRVYDECLGWMRSGRVKRLGDIAMEFDRFRRHGLSLNVKEVIGKSSGVSVMTAHQAKGLEFAVVFIPHLIDSIWGGRGRSSLFKLPLRPIELSSGDEIDDERRLLYVALTRAKKELICTYSQVSSDGREQVAARFALDIATHFEVSEDASTENDISLSKVIVAAKRPVVDQECLQKYLLERGWSATSLNNYLKSPWDFIYKNVLRYPEPKTRELEFGTLVHDLIELISRRLSSKQPLSDQELISIIKNRVDDFNLLPVDAAKFHERAEASVFGYLPKLEKIVDAQTQIELKINADFNVELAGLPVVRLTGKFDRVDRDETGCVRQVTDYKTGKVRTRGEIMGQTKNSRGNPYRQLTFYALLLSLQDDPNFQCSSTALVYLEPNEKGVQKEEFFTISKQETDSLKELICRVTEEVWTGSCLNKECDPLDSDFCRLVG